jgi:hypothetical protein
MPAISMVYTAMCLPFVDLDRAVAERLHQLVEASSSADLVHSTLFLTTFAYSSGTLAGACEQAIRAPTLDNQAGSR